MLDDETIVTMNTERMLIERHTTLHEFFLTGFESVPDRELLRVRPHPRANSLAWNLWHVARAEDFGVNSFVADRPQVFNAEWMRRMNVPWRHGGSGMSLDEVDAFNAMVNLDGVREYRLAVAEATREVLGRLHRIDLDRTLDDARVRRIMIDDGVAHSDPEGMVKNYLGRSGERCLLTYALTHSYEHVGEMDVLATLLGISMD